MDDRTSNVRTPETLAPVETFSFDEEARHACVPLQADDALLPTCTERRPNTRCSARDRELFRNRFPVEW
jgi:hypothetical protein